MKRTNWRESKCFAYYYDYEQSHFMCVCVCVFFGSFCLHFNFYFFLFFFFSIHDCSMPINGGCASCFSLCLYFINNIAIHKIMCILEIQMVDDGHMGFWCCYYCLVVIYIILTISYCDALFIVLERSKWKANRYDYDTSHRQTHMQIHKPNYRAICKHINDVYYILLYNNSIAQCVHAIMFQCMAVCLLLCPCLCTHKNEHKTYKNKAKNIN